MNPTNVMEVKCTFFILVLELKTRGNREPYLDKTEAGSCALVFLYLLQSSYSLTSQGVNDLRSVK